MGVQQVKIGLQLATNKSRRKKKKSLNAKGGHFTIIEPSSSAPFLGGLRIKSCSQGVAFAESLTKKITLIHCHLNLQ